MKFKKFMKIIVNLITTGRLVGTFILLMLIPIISEYVFLFGVAVLFFSDFVDGMLARKFKVQSLYGSTMDTIADKFLSVVMMLPLLFKIEIIFIVLLGELGIAFLNVYGRVKGKHTKSSMIGKIKMWFLAINVILGYCYIFEYISLIVGIISCVVTFVIQLVVMFSYYIYLKKQKSKKKLKKKINNYKELVYILFSTDYYIENVLTLDNEL